MTAGPLDSPDPENGPSVKGPCCAPVLAEGRVDQGEEVLFRLEGGGDLVEGEGDDLAAGAGGDEGAMAAGDRPGVSPPTPAARKGRGDHAGSVAGAGPQTAGEQGRREPGEVTPGGDERTADPAERHVPVRAVGQGPVLGGEVGAGVRPLEPGFVAGPVGVAHPEHLVTGGGVLPVTRRGRQSERPRHQLARLEMLPLRRVEIVRQSAGVPQKIPPAPIVIGRVDQPRHKALHGIPEQQPPLRHELQDDSSREHLGHTPGPQPLRDIHRTPTTQIRRSGNLTPPATGPAPDQNHKSETRTASQCDSRLTPLPLPPTRKSRSAPVSA